MPAANKDTIYIDVEDEITAVIDKTLSAKSKIVALVLPKRTTVLQSAVNMKLLKKAAKSVNKNIVLITSEQAIISIAGVSGVHVAKTLSTKPGIPSSSTGSKLEIENVTLDENSEIAPSVTEIDKEEHIELDNTEGASEAVAPAVKVKKHKIMKIPDFSSFRLRMGLGITVLLLITIMWFFGFVILPKANITITTNTSTTEINAVSTLRVGAKDLDLEKNVIPVERVQIEKVDTVTVPATGQKNIGNRATGKMNLTNCINSDGVQVVPAGTRFSAGSLTYESTEQAILPEASFNYSRTTCTSKEKGDDKTVGVIAIDAGAQFNVGAQDYNSAISGIRATGSAMGGGTTENVKVISPEDVKTAKEQLDGKSRSAAIAELSKQLQDKDKMPIPETLGEGTPKDDMTPAVGTEADTLKVTTTISYNLSGISEDDLKKILDNEIEKQNTENPKNIKDNGLSAVKFKVVERPNDSDIKMTIETVATLGPNIEAEKIKDQVAGKKRGDIEKQLEAIDGVRSVGVEYSPLWITTTPKSADKINVIFVENDTK